MSSPHQLNPQLLVDALYCEEEHHWDTNDSEQGDNINSNYHNTPLLLHLEQGGEDEELASLLHKEQESQLQGSPDQNPAMAKARGDAVEWILKVVHYYSFSALTAVLAVNYLDRFLHTFESKSLVGETEKKQPWMTQLAAVACISLAAKVEETHVPLLLDLQVEESDYVFESKTIQRMEILVLSTLQWRMNPVTPISFLDCIASKLGFFTHFSREFLRRCHCLLLSLLSDCRLMKYLPSALATATMLYVISRVEPTVGVEHHRHLIGILGINNQDEVENCCRLIEEVATSSGFFFFSCNKRKVGWIPASPKGVVDVCFSSGDSSAAASPEQLSKKFKSK